MGHPIANDPIYSLATIWGPELGKGGVDTSTTITSEERLPPAPPEHANLKFDDALSNPESLVGTETSEGPRQTKLMPRETGHDIGMGSPVPLSKESVQIITRLRNMKVSAIGLGYNIMLTPE